jgi:hypothetical protein
MKKTSGFTGSNEDIFNAMDDRLKNESQCYPTARYNIAMTEVIVECCRSSAYNGASDLSLGIDEHKIWSYEEANNYIKNNITDWRNVDEI